MFLHRNKISKNLVHLKNCSCTRTCLSVLHFNFFLHRLLGCNSSMRGKLSAEFLNFVEQICQLTLLCPEADPITANEQGLWQVGDLKLVRPNVCRYKLLLFNYLQIFSRFPSAETKVQKNSKSSINHVSPRLPQTHVGGSFYFHVKLVLRLFTLGKICCKSYQN